MLEIHSSLDGIIGAKKKLKDAEQDIVTVTIETNLRQGDLETEVDGTKGDLSETETESNEALSEWEEGRINDFGPERASLCLRKRKQDDVSTSVLSVKVNEIQTLVGESSFGSGRVCSEF